MLCAASPSADADIVFIDSACSSAGPSGRPSAGGTLTYWRASHFDNVLTIVRRLIVFALRVRVRSALDRSIDLVEGLIVLVFIDAPAKIELGILDQPLTLSVGIKA